MLPVVGNGQQQPQPSSSNSSFVRPNDSTYWVVPGKFLAGEYPGSKLGPEATRRRIRDYLDCGVNNFLDLTAEHEREDYKSILLEEASDRGREDDIAYHRMSIPDFGIPEDKDQMRKILDVIDQVVTVEENVGDGLVYVHCRGGIGRTGTVVGCYLVRHYGITGNEALEVTNRLFQASDRRFESYSSPETREQMRFVREWNEE